MNQVVAVITALVMLMTGLGTATSPLEAPVVEEVSATLDAGTLSALIDAIVPEDAGWFARWNAERGKAAARTAGNLINGTRARMVADRGYAEVSLSVRDRVLWNAAFRTDDTGMTVATSLLPDTAITVSAGTAQELTLQFLQRIAARMGETALLEADGNADARKLLFAALDIYNRSAEELSERIGHAETGSFSVDGMTFTRKAPVNLSLQGAKMTVLKALKALAEHKAVKPALDRIPYGRSLSGRLDQAMEEAAKETPRKLDIILYENPDRQDAYLRVAGVPEEGMEYDGPRAGFGQVDGQFIVIADSGTAEPKTHIELAADENRLSLQAEVAGPQNKALALSLESGREGALAALTWGGRTLIRLEETVTTAEQVERITDSAKKVIRAEDLMKENLRAVLSFRGRLLSGTLSTLGRLLRLAGPAKSTETVVKLPPVQISTGENP